MENVIILGSGCAGFTAAIYAARANLSPLVLGGLESGGQLMLTTEVENFPGFPEGIMGPELIANMRKQAERFGARFDDVNATSFTVKDKHLELGTENGVLQTKTLIIATGASAKMLGIPSEKQYLGRGVSTCATCDGFFYKDKEIIVVGGGDSACEEALFLTKFAKKLTIVHRRDAFRASKIMQDRVFANKKITVVWNSAVEEIQGDGKKVSGVTLKNIETGNVTHLQVDGIFIAIGHTPNTRIFGNQIKVDDHGFIITDKHSHTNISGVFAAGDVQDPVFKQAVTSAGTGCQAAMEAEKYLERYI
ncbi:thioredoxin-disulfide reductase [Candidatus Woesearchaeota archaeon]|nr:thioredoxin-disulfide reductase [Candidatus Woesearchaeota archaeon]